MVIKKDNFYQIRECRYGLSLPFLSMRLYEKHIAAIGEKRGRQHIGSIMHFLTNEHNARSKRKEN